MNTNFKSSFIPKEPTTTEQVFKRSGSGFLGFLTATFFTVSVLAAGGLYFYKGMLKSEIQSLQSELAEAEDSIDKKTIDEMNRFSKKLAAAREIVLRHQAVTNFMNTLSSNTVSSVQLTDFGYTYAPDELTVQLKGRASDYGSVALQESVLYNRVSSVKTLSFENLSLDTRGFVTFDLKVVVDPRIAIYNPPISAPVEPSRSTPTSTATSTNQ
jgi:hypothetical protein